MLSSYDDCGDFSISLPCNDVCPITIQSTATTCFKKSNKDNYDNTAPNSTNISFNGEDRFHVLRPEDHSPPANTVFDKNFLTHFSVVDGDDVWSETAESVYSYNGSSTRNKKDLWMVTINISYKTYSGTDQWNGMGDNPVKLYLYVDGTKKFCRTYRNNRIRDDIILVVQPTNCVGFQIKPGQTLDYNIDRIKMGKFSYIKFSKFNICPDDLSGITNPSS